MLQCAQQAYNSSSALLEPNAVMGKWVQYTKWFQKSWFKNATFRGWLEEVKDDKKKAYCKCERCNFPSS